MEQTLFDKYSERKKEEYFYPAFKELLNTILDNYDLSIFERIVWTFSKDNTIVSNMKSVKLDNRSIELLHKFIKMFDNDIEVIDYSNYSEITRFVNKYADKEIYLDQLCFNDKIDNNADKKKVFKPLSYNNINICDPYYDNISIHDFNDFLDKIIKNNY